MSLRTLRKLLDVGLPIAGMAIVFASMLLLTDLTAQVMVVLVGVLTIEAGVWQLTNPFMPNERRYLALREEVDDFIGLVRQLNTAGVIVREEASVQARSELEGVREAMLRSLDRMAEVAGQTGADAHGTPLAV